MLGSVRPPPPSGPQCALQQVANDYINDLSPPEEGSSRTASERRWNTLKSFKGFYLNAKARSWPRLSYQCHIGSTADCRGTSLIRNRPPPLGPP